MTELTERLTSALADRYRIERELGQGGMATVYLAEDLRHQRRVAIKVLKPELAAVLGAERFVQEITTTASLQHPHILPLFDSGTADSFLFYVMPYVEGETLRAKLDRERQLGVDEAVRITREVADALDYAHRNGVIHRDIKPENILLHDGRPMVADFGIALAVSAAAGGRMTETGLSLGTPHYMSPEQATAEKEITARSDVYSLASVLYEMLAGQPPHLGGSAQQIIMKIIADQARSVTELRKAVPPNVAAALTRALEKLPADRFASAAEFAAALANPAFATAGVSAPHGAMASRAGRRLVAALAGVCVVAVTVAAWGWLRPRAEPAVSRQWVNLGVMRRHGALSVGWAVNSALAPDGSAIVFADSGPPRQPLWIKERGSAQANPLLGSDGGSQPFFSPDGQWVGFATESGLFKVPRGGGAPLLISDSGTSFRGGTFPTAAWLDDGSVVFLNRDRLALMQMSRDGTLRTAVSLSGTDYPFFLVSLPGSRGVLMVACSAFPCAGGRLEVADLRRDTVRTLVDGATRAWYLDAGYVVYGRGDGTLVAQGFDPAGMELSGAPVAVLAGVQSGAGSPSAIMSPNGTVLYSTGSNDVRIVADLVAVDRRGGETVLDTTLVPAGQGVSGIALAPDGRRIALVQANSEGADVYVMPFPSGPLTRLTFGGRVRRPSWSPDGREVLYVSEVEGQEVGMRRPADGSGSETEVVREARPIVEVLLSPDGEWLVWRTDNGVEGRGDILARRTSGDTTTVRLADSPFEETGPAVSPDGRWLAYASDQNGDQEVFVRELSASDGGRVQVSRSGGAVPRWSRDGRELFFRGRGQGLMMAARVETAPDFRVLDVQPLFPRGNYQIGDRTHAMYDVMPDGRLLMTRPHVTFDDSDMSRMILIENWLSEIEPLLRH